MTINIETLLSIVVILCIGADLYSNYVDRRRLKKLIAVKDAHIAALTDQIKSKRTKKKGDVKSLLDMVGSLKDAVHLPTPKQDDEWEELIGGDDTIKKEDGGVN